MSEFSNTETICNKVNGMTYTDIIVHSLDQLASNITILHIILLIVAYKLVHFLHRQYIYYTMRSKNLKKIAARQRIVSKLYGDDCAYSRCAEDIGHNIPIEMAKNLPKMDMHDILSLLDNKEVTSLQMVKFFHHRSRTVGYKLKNLCDSLYEEAIELAKSADKLRSTGNYDKKLKPFLGVPISLKESILIAGKETTAGFANRLGDYPNETCAVVPLLISLGAIPIVRSNIPQFLMAMEGINEIYGTCENPHDRERSSGGSSSGEGS